MKQNGIYNGDIQRTPITGSDEEVVEPVSLADGTNWARVDVTDDNALITGLIKTARIQIEKYLNISIIPTTIEATILCQLGNYALPYGPVTSVVSLYDGTTAITDYTLKGGLFKSLVCAYCDPLTIVYEAGYAVCLEDYKTAIKQQTLYLYDNRGDEAMMSKLSPIVLAKLYGDRRIV